MDVSWNLWLPNIPENASPGTPRDFRGTPVEVGDTVCWAVRDSGGAYMNEGEVTEVVVDREVQSGWSSEPAGRIKHTIKLKCRSTGRGTDAWNTPAVGRKVTLSEMKWVVLP